MSRVDGHSVTAEEYEEIPELTDDWFDRAELRVGGKIIRRGRPPVESPTRSVHLRLDAEVLDHFRATGPGWQTRLNETLVRSVRRAKARG